MQLVDIGINLFSAQFDADRNAVLERAVKAGVALMILTGTSEETSLQAAAFASARPQHLRATAGIHPHHARDVNFATLQALKRLLAEEQVVAVGECGLDWNRNFSPRESQLYAFEAQVEIACERRDKPLFLHERDAHEDLLRVLERYQGDLPEVVVHCFTGNADQAKTYLAAGFYLGITGWVSDNRRGRALQEAIPCIPLDKLMVETDAPYLIPQNLPAPSGRRNEPAYLRFVVEKIAGLQGVSSAEIAAATTSNARRFFRLDSLPGYPQEIAG